MDLRFSAAEEAFRAALRVVRPGLRVRDLGRVVRDEVERHGFSVVPMLQGHGIGRSIHEDPMIPNWPDPTARGQLAEGMVITIEPIITMGTGDAHEADDGWTILSSDGTLAAHHEHTLVVRRTGPLLLTAE